MPDPKPKGAAPGERSADVSKQVPPEQKKEGDPPCSGSGDKHIEPPGGGGKDTPACAKDKCGSFLLWTADQLGKETNRPRDAARPPQDPSDKNARQIVFTPNPAFNKPSLREDLEICDRCDRLIHALNHLYPAGDATAEAKFRLFYARVFGLGQLALETRGVEMDTAKKELDIIDMDLIGDEGPRVKNGHIKDLLRSATWLSIPFAIAYIVLSHVPDNGVLGTWLRQLGVQRTTLANFMLLWLGCFLGVCLSYALRKPQFTQVDELVTAEGDFLLPIIRLAFIGTLTMLLVMFSMLEIVDVSIAKNKLSDVVGADKQMLAFVVGVICGIGELLLPSAIMTKTKSLIGNIK